MSSANSSSANSSALGWHILHFDHQESNGQRKSIDIIFTTDPRKSVQAQKDELEIILFKKFDRMGDWKNGDSFSIKRLLIQTDSSSGNNSEVEITSSQLIEYLRQLQPSMTAQRPNILGFGTNNIRVEFEYHDMMEEMNEMNEEYY